ncbi:D-proline reductase (dithiol) proprotein PrdA [Enterococcus xiangfangensis]|uniref:D-proline reductase (Dithiol) proprotein PrdA n=1 Tax=Enterococcus xiangfangensis TaxID=1296537 RepID=A0ABU3F980_9ENTE|nr:D-proline reductase (dithiol) proprotein PrdA [Enterococcus xiangfangensis]MBM7711056.1 D-proline reductase (dithiol) PrdA [Enterococcus xiangfangensis]MDT2759224.1 D-proline reductase (dithiol) proprotein PrdA [Enterococcus xiangfangensis]NBK07770.1 D-proline reductase (dithiol) proprotein PrdA [Enterococcus asini]
MSITAETAKEHAKDPAVLCCRAEAGKVIAPDDLEDPAIFPDLEDSGLLELPENALTIEQVLGTTLKETTDALIPLTKELLDGVVEVAEEAEEAPAETAETPVEAPAPIAPVAPVAPVAQFGGQTIKIHIAEGRGIDLEVPMSVASQVGVAPAAPAAPVAAQAPAEQAEVAAPEAKVEEKVIRSVRHDHLKIDKIVFGEETKIEGTTLTLRNMEEMCAEAVELEKLVESMTLEIITPDKYSEYSETIMDVQPIATKVEGDIGHGITRVLDGVVMVVTGTDSNGVQIGEFGSSEGELDRNIMWGRPGAPEKGEIFIKTQVTIREHANMERPGPLAAHHVSDHITQEIREALKKADDSLVVDSEEIVQKRRIGNKKVLIVKEIMGQGAMHDNLIMPIEPVGTLGAKPNVDLGNLPIMLAPTEVLDGGLHALTCIGPASKETSRHYWREPLVKEAMADEEIDLVGVMFVGSPQANTEKYYVSKRLGMTIEAMDIDGAIVTTEGFGNNHIDFASHIEEIGKRGVKVVGDSYSAVQGALVVGNAEMGAMVDNNKSKQGIENEILSNNTLCQEDAIRDLAMLKTLMGGGEIKAAERKWNPNVKANNIEIIEKTTGKKINLAENEQVLPKSKKRQEIYEKD